MRLRSVFHRLPMLALFSAVAFSVSVSRSNAGEERRFAHVQGTTVIPEVPKTVAVFDLAALDILDSLEVPVAGVPAMDSTTWPAYLQKYADDQYVRIGSLFDPDFEALKALKPDLIIISSRARSNYAELSAIAPTIDLSTATTGFVPSVIENTLTLGTIFGVERKANLKARELLATIRQLQENAAEQGTGLLLFGYHEAISAPMPATRFGVVYEVVGIQPIVTQADALPNFPRPPRGTPAPVDGSPEAEAAKALAKERAKAQARQLAEVLPREPDWIFVIDRDAAFQDRANASDVMATIPAIADSTAWKEQRVVHLDGGGWYLVGGGVQQLENTIQQLNAAFEKTPRETPATE